MPDREFGARDSQGEEVVSETTDNPAMEEFTTPREDQNASEPELEKKQGVDSEDKDELTAPAATSPAGTGSGVPAPPTPTTTRTTTGPGGTSTTTSPA
jgi:hypothetical protein